MRRGLKAARLAVALACLAGFGLALTDFRTLAPSALARGLAALQFGPAVLGALAGGTGALAVVGGLLLLTAIFGRLYCSTLCPLGLLQDAVARISHWLHPRRRPLPFRPPATRLRHAILGLTLLAFAVGAGALALTALDPYSHFGRIVTTLLRPLVVLANNLLAPVVRAAGGQWLFRASVPSAGVAVVVFAGATLALIAALAAWRGRLYCNTICPVGTALGLLARVGAMKLTLTSSACTKCASCLHACKAQCLDLRHGTIDASRCVVCFNCVSACPERGIHWTWTWRKRSAPVPTASAVAIAAERRALLAGAAGALLLPATALAGGASPTRAPAADTSAPATPPGARGVRELLDRCTACQLCVSACPTGVLRPAGWDYGWRGLAKPRLDFERSFCNYDCRRCGEVCPTGAIALLPLADKQLTSIGCAEFTRSRCIVETDGTDCAACSEHCPTKAVNTVPFRDNLRLPQVQDDLCIGCGACEYACPVRPARAIQVRARPTHQRARRAVTEKAELPPAGDFPF